MGTISQAIAASEREKVLEVLADAEVVATEYLECAYDDPKCGDWSRDPFIMPVAPSFVDATVAQPGKHVVHLFGGHALYSLRDGRWETRKDDLVKNVLRVMEDYAPGLSGGIIGMRVLTPPDIERIISSPHGHIFHGELQPDRRFFVRLAPHSADCRSPIEGLYQYGSSAHPGGGVGGYRRPQRCARNPARSAAMRVENLRHTVSGRFMHKGLAAQSA